MDEDLAALNQKIDLLSTQVAYLTEQARLNARAQAERAELAHDLTPVVNDAYRLAVEQLEEVEQYVSLDDLLRLAKRLLRNGRNIEKMLDQLESVSDLLETIGPLTDGAVGKAVAELDTLERKGYFAFARGGARMVDQVVTSFGEDDVRLLGDNVVLILQTIKDLTQPDIMNFVRNTVEVIDREKEQPVDTSLVALWRQMRDPNVRRGLALTLRVLRTIGVQSND